MTTDGPLEEGSPRPAENSVTAPQDAMSLLAWDGARAASEDGLPVAKEATPVATHDAPPVIASDIFLSSEKGTPRTSGRSRSKPRSLARGIRTVIAYILLLAILGAAGVAAVALVRGTWMVTPVLSGSMRPGLSVGGVVISQRVPVDSLHVRDVIIFLDPYKSSEQIVHRIVKITKGSGGKLLFNTQGRCQQRP